MLQKSIIVTISMAMIFISLCTGCAPANNGDPNADLNRDNAFQGQRMDGAGQQKGYQGKQYRPLNRSDARDQQGTEQRQGVLPFAFNGWMEDRQDDQQGRGGMMPNGQRMIGFQEHAFDDPEVVNEQYGAHTYIDRELLADTVSQIVVGMRDVDTSSVLITDEDCIIGFQSSNENDETLENVELSGLSVTPRWYKVYATQDQEIINAMREIAQAQTNGQLDYRSLQDHVDGLINQLGGPKETWEQTDNINPNMNTNKDNKKMDSETE